MISGHGILCGYELQMGLPWMMHSSHLSHCTSLNSKTCRSDGCDRGSVVQSWDEMPAPAATAALFVRAGCMVPLPFLEITQMVTSRSGENGWGVLSFKGICHDRFAALVLVTPRVSPGSPARVLRSSFYPRDFVNTSADAAASLTEMLQKESGDLVKANLFLSPSPRGPPTCVSMWRSGDPRRGVGECRTRPVHHVAFLPSTSSLHPFSALELNQRVPGS